MVQFWAVWVGCANARPHAVVVCTCKKFGSDLWWLTVPNTRAWASPQAPCDAAFQPSSHVRLCQVALVTGKRLHSCTYCNLAVTSDAFAFKATTHQQGGFVLKLVRSQAGLSWSQAWQNGDWQVGSCSIAYYGTRRS